MHAYKYMTRFVSYSRIIRRGCYRHARKLTYNLRFTMHCIEYYLPTDVPVLTKMVTASDVLYRGCNSLEYMANTNYAAFMEDLFDKHSAPKIFHDARQPVVEVPPDVDFRVRPPSGDRQ